MDELRIGTRIIWGADALNALKELAGQRVLVVSDGFLAKSGMLERVLRPLEGSRTAVFDQVDGEPTLEMVAKGVVALNKLDPQAVVAFGGGSAMDCAKALGYCAGREVPLWCIPTTAGTGAEVTRFSVLADSATGLKYPLVDDRLLPYAALLDPQFLEKVPQNVTADTAFDVLTHAAEAFVAVGANPFTDALAQEAFSITYAQIPAAQAGDREARGKILFASMLAGVAFDGAGLGVCHALAHALGHRLHAPHGRVNALLLPLAIEANAQDQRVAKKYGKLAQMCGISPSARALAGGLRRLGRRVGMPEKLPGKDLDVAAVVADAQRDPCMPDNVKYFTDDELKKLIQGLIL